MKARNVVECLFVGIRGAVNLLDQMCFAVLRSTVANSLACR